MFAVAADVTGCAKTPKWHFGRTKKGFSDPSPPKKTRHIETVEVVFPGSPAGEEFSHSLVRRRKKRAILARNPPPHVGGYDAVLLLHCAMIYPPFKPIQ